MIATKKPQYSDERRIDMMAYMGPRRAGKHLYHDEYGTYPMDPEEGYPSFITDEVFELYKNVGLNILLPEGDAFFEQNVTKDGFVYEPDFEKSDLYAYMKMAQKHDLIVYPATEEIFGHMAHEPGPFGDKEKEHVKHFIETVQAYFPDTFRGIMLTDEPQYPAIERMTKVVEYIRSDEIRAIKDNIEFFTTMLPIYGQMKSFHPDYSDESYQRLKYDKDRLTAYQYYMEKTSDAMKEVSYDYYALIYEHQLTPGFYLNMELAAEYAKEKGYPFTIALQSFRMDVNYNEKTGRSLMVYRTPHYEDIRWQVYSALAFGASRIAYYTFWTHYGLSSHTVQQNAMVVFDPSEDKGYRTTEIYDAVKLVNDEILGFDHVFLRFKWKGTKVVRTSRERNIQLVKAGYEDEVLQEVTATRDLLVGCMENPEDGTSGYWIVNAENPFRCQLNDVKVKFKGAERVIYYRKGKEYDEALSDETFTIRLAVGEGIFVLPYSDMKE